MFPAKPHPMPRGPCLNWLLKAMFHMRPNGMHETLPFASATTATFDEFAVSAALACVAKIKPTVKTAHIAANSKAKALIFKSIFTFTSASVSKTISKSAIKRFFKIQPIKFPFITQINP
jgi:hypothetical protein